MRWEAYVLMLFSISLPLYYLGYGPIIALYDAQNGQLITIACPETDNALCLTPSSNSILGSIVPLIVGGLAAALIALALGFGAIYIYPIIILFAILSLNVFIFPFNFILSAGFPDAIGIPLIVLYNIATIMAVVNFVRGGS